MNLRDRFQRNVEHLRLWQPGDRLLVAVSGGIDSQTLLDLLSKTHDRDRLAVAHCNFGLRGVEADTETDLVRNTCLTLGVTCHIVRFDTHAQCEETGESTQMAARRLRYDFFEQLCVQYKYDKVAVAHNFDDSVETLFINLFRGCGLPGVQGIPALNGRIVRPLMFATRAEIIDYTHQNDVKYLTDSSNNEDHYLRNKLRHKVLPQLREASPTFDAVMAGNFQRLSAHARFENDVIDGVRTRVLCKKGIHLPKFRAEDGCGVFLLYQLLKPYGFSSQVSHDIYHSIEGGESTGRRFYAPGFEAVLDRDMLSIRPRSETKECESWIHRDDPQIEVISAAGIPNLIGEQCEAYFDADLVAFPLLLRRWQAGDKLVPFGMRGHKKVSDLLTDAKVSSADRPAYKVLISGDRVIWVVGVRTDDRVKVTSQTKNVIRIRL